MTRLQHATSANGLLRRLTPGDFDRLAPDLRPVEVDLLDLLVAPGEPVTTVYFPESGYGSVLAVGNGGGGGGGGGGIEIGLIGREGVIGAAPILLDVDRTPHRTLVQQAGTMLSLPAAALAEAVARSETLRRFLLRYIHVQGLQVASTAYSNATYTIDVRLARWLLMCHDRVAGDEIRITHDFMAMMLGVQRASATIAVQTLEGNGLIRAQRGRVTIRDRARLLEMAEGSYGSAEAEYARLIATP